MGRVGEREGERGVEREGGERGREGRERGGERGGREGERWGGERKLFLKICMKKLLSSDWLR